MRAIDYVVIHTAAAATESGHALYQPIEEIDRYHREHNGWDRIGYHWYVDGDGEGFRGRQDADEGAHVKTFNARTLGLCVAGHGDLAPFTPAQTAEVVRTCVEWCELYGLDPSRVVGHRECDELPAYRGGPAIRKTCPGTLVNMNAIRAAVQAALGPSVDLGEEIALRRLVAELEMDLGALRSRVAELERLALQNRPVGSGIARG